MKASECLKKPKDVAVCETGEMVAVAINSEEAWCWGLHRKIHYHPFKEFIKTLRGDDWTPLAPQTPIEELQRYRCGAYRDTKVIYTTEDADGRWVRYSDLESAAYTKDSEQLAKLQRDLEAAEYERDLARAEQSREYDSYQKQIKHDWEYRQSLESELSTLRQQLEGQCVLGEPLTRLYDGQYVLRVCNQSKRMDAFRVDVESTDGVSPWGDYTYYAWTPPKLPEPEPVVEVPKWLNPIGVFWNGDIYGWALHVDSGSNVLIEWGPTYRVWNDHVDTLELYTSPVKHPDGTIAPIEPSSELVEALKGAKDE